MDMKTGLTLYWVGRLGRPTLYFSADSEEFEVYGPDSREYCPSCGQPDVTVGLNRVLIETAPTVRFHACR